MAEQDYTPHRTKHHTTPEQNTKPHHARTPHPPHHTRTLHQTTPNLNNLPHHTTPYDLNHTTPHNTTPIRAHHTTPRYTIPHHPNHTTLYHTTLKKTTPHRTCLQKLSFLFRRLFNLKFYYLFNLEQCSNKR
jgi:hypothetical protein